WIPIPSCAVPTCSISLVGRSDVGIRFRHVGRTQLAPVVEISFVCVLVEAMSLQVFRTEHHRVVALHLHMLVVFLNFSLSAKYSDDSLIRSEIVKSFLLQASRRIAFVDDQAILRMYIRHFHGRLALLYRYFGIRKIWRNHLHFAAIAHSKKHSRREQHFGFAELR